MKRISLSIILSLGLAGFGMACSKDEAPVDEPVAYEPSVGAEEEPFEPEEPAGPVDPDDVHLEGDHITIDQHILFETNSDVILDDSSEILDHLATFLGNHQEDVGALQVVGHTDAQGNRGHNQRLSERRAAAVVNALRERGVTQELTAIGKGNTEKLCRENTDECHDRNRRVEFIVVQ